MYCKYYQAHVLKNKVWFLVSALRSFDHLVFDRTYDKEKSIFEFFIPADLEPYFLDLMHYFEKNGLIFSFQELPNRLQKDSTL